MAESYVPDSYVSEIPHITADKLCEQVMIGEGGFSTVLRAKHTEWGPVAIKKLKMRIGQEKSFEEEMSKHLNLRHPNIIQFLGIVSDGDERCQIVLEFAAHGSLDQFIRLHPGVASCLKTQWAVEICRAVNYLHTRQSPIIHRDLKLPNVLVAEAFIMKISDFGVSQYKQPGEYYEESGSALGTSSHMAPELILEDTGAVSVASDVYSFSILLWELHTERTAYQGKTLPQLMRGVCDGERPPTDGLADEVKTIVTRCWAKQPQDRPSFNDVLSYLEPKVDPTLVNQAKIKLSQSVEKKRSRRSLGGDTSMDGSVSNSTSSMQNPSNLILSSSHTSNIQENSASVPKATTTGGNVSVGVQRQTITDVSATDLSALRIDPNMSHQPTSPPSSQILSNSHSPKPQLSTESKIPNYGVIDLHPEKSKIDAPSFLLNQLQEVDCQRNRCATNAKVSPADPPEKFDPCQVVLDKLGEPTTADAAAAVGPDPNKLLCEDASPVSGSCQWGRQNSQGADLTEGNLRSTSDDSLTRGSSSSLDSMKRLSGGSKHDQEKPPITDSLDKPEVKPPTNEFPRDTTKHTVINLSNVQGGIQIGNNNVMYTGGAHPAPAPPRPTAPYNVRPNYRPMPQNNTGRTKIEVPPKLITTEVMIYMSEHLGKSWRSLGLQLKLTNGQLDALEHDFQPRGGLREIIYQMLLKWQNREGPGAKYAALAKALVAVHRADLAMQLQHM